MSHGLAQDATVGAEDRAPEIAVAESIPMDFLDNAFQSLSENAKSPLHDLPDCQPIDDGCIAKSAFEELSDVEIGEDICDVDVRETLRAKKKARGRTLELRQSNVPKKSEKEKKRTGFPKQARKVIKIANNRCTRRERNLKKKLNETRTVLKGLLKVAQHVALRPT